MVNDERVPMTVTDVSKGTLGIVSIVHGSTPLNDLTKEQINFGLDQPIQKIMRLIQ